MTLEERVLGALTLVEEPMTWIRIRDLVYAATGKQHNYETMDAALRSLLKQGKVVAEDDGRNFHWSVAPEPVGAAEAEMQELIRSTMANCGPMLKALGISEAESDRAIRKMAPALDEEDLIAGMMGMHRAIVDLAFEERMSASLAGFAIMAFSSGAAGQINAHEEMVRSAVGRLAR